MTAHLKTQKRKGFCDWLLPRNIKLYRDGAVFLLKYIARHDMSKDVRITHVTLELNGRNTTPGPCPLGGGPAALAAAGRLSLGLCRVAVQLKGSAPLRVPACLADTIVLRSCALGLQDTALQET